MQQQQKIMTGSKMYNSQSPKVKLTEAESSSKVPVSDETN